MKKFLLLGLICVLFSCKSNQNEHTKEVQNQIDSLKTKLSETYKHGFGEFMGTIQVHHSKLWFAGIKGNWKLADFEINEIKENLEAIQKYETNRPESKEIPMINPALDSMSIAIQNKNLLQFKSSFNLLTHTCVECHQATGHEFIQIVIPEKPVFSNQKFKMDE